MKIIKKMTTLWGRIKFYTSKIFRRKGYGISILVPFHSSDPTNQRAKNWEWLERYWSKQLPGAEIIVGEDSEANNGKAFSKSCAVNDAVSKASGDIFVIVDADGYISVDAVIRCAKEIRNARKKKRKLWFVPYRKFYRLTEEASSSILDSNPEDPIKYEDDPPANHILNAALFKGTSGSALGHWYGALIQIMPREAFEKVGGWDPRFRGWGGEDHAAMRAMDTLYWPHKTLPSPVFHIWHPIMHVESNNPTRSKNRLWENQDHESTNDKLSHRYYWSQGNIDRMRKLVDEWKKASSK